MDDKIYYNSLSSLIFKVKKNQIKMVRDRGYDIRDELLILNFTVSQFIEYYVQQAHVTKRTFRDALSRIYINEKGEKILVFYFETEAGSKRILTSQCEELLEFIVKNIRDTTKNLKEIILICEVPIPSEIQSKLLDLRNYSIQIFLYDELGYNLTEHYLVPKHEFLSESETKQFLKNNQLDPTLLPLMSIHDPVAKYYGILPKRIVKIYRTNILSETMIDNYIAYRYTEDIPFETNNDSKNYEIRDDD